MGTAKTQSTGESPCVCVCLCMCVGGYGRVGGRDQALRATGGGIFMEELSSKGGSISANTWLRMSHDIKVALNPTRKITMLSVRCFREV